MPERPPNIVFILSDDQGPWAAGCCGNPEIRTPNIDTLAAEGVRFTDFFCTSPVCSPARASILTGHIPSRHGVHDWISHGNIPPEARQYLSGFTCYTDLMARAGYACGLSGKWHLGDSLVPQHGFGHWFCHQKGAGPYNGAPMVKDGRMVTVDGYVTDAITDDAVAFIDRHREVPFYLGINYTAPHAPWTGHPREFVELYDECPFESCPQEPLHPHAGPLTRSSYGKREMLQGYFAAVTAMDSGIGRVLGRLDELGLRNRTLVVFSSDNGFSCGHHGFWGKGNGTFPINMYENSVKVPAIFRCPGVLPQGRVSGALASQYDFFPTLLAFLGLSVPGKDLLPGRDLLPVLKGEREEAGEEIVVYDEYGPVRMIRTREWKYVHRYPYGYHELYDMIHDPGERRNLAEDPGRRLLIEDLRRRMGAWFLRHGDPALDGLRFPVSGSGQMDKIGEETPGENCFSSERIGIHENGFPGIRQE